MRLARRKESRAQLRHLHCRDFHMYPSHAKAAERKVLRKVYASMQAPIHARTAAKIKRGCYAHSKHRRPLRIFRPAGFACSVRQLGAHGGSESLRFDGMRGIASLRDKLLQHREPSELRTV
jgi:hypothetical protein